MNKFQTGISLLLVLLNLYFINGEETVDCSVITNCKTCPDPPPICLDCSAGKLLAKDGLKCLTCPSNCVTCTQPSSDYKTECSKCQTGYYLTTDKKCSACPGNCAECTTSNDCTKCMAVYFNKPLEIECADCPANCARCTTSTMCDECHQGFYLDSLKQCAACIGNHLLCLKCKSAGTCDLCASGKYFKDGTCINCIDHCQKCETSSGCESCQAGYWLTADKTKCNSASHCSTYEDANGCSVCNKEYKLTSDKTCEACQALTSNTCSKCKKTNLGRFWDTNQCDYCPTDCLACTAANNCQRCIDGKVWDASSCKACSTANLNSQAKCQVCSGKYWESTCKTCPTTFEDKNTAGKCGQCPESDRSLFWSVGECNDVDCSQSSLTEVQCNSCPQKGWIGSACFHASDCANQAHLNSKEKCELCELNYWQPDTCIALPDGCQGTFASSEDKCTRCQHHAWIDNKCQAIDCSKSANEVSNPAECDACPGRYFEGGTCKSADCSNILSLTTASTCNSCAPWYNYAFIGGVCVELFDCSAPGDQVNCTACGMVWTTACAAPTCSGVFDQTKCEQCRGKTWVVAAKECHAVDCDAASLTENVCNSCPKRYFEDNTCKTVSKCSEIDSSTPQNQCESCRFEKFYWGNGSCLQMTGDCTVTTALTTKSKCHSCLENIWRLAECKQIGVCPTGDPSTLNEIKCERCPKTFWDTSAGACKAINCAQTLDTERKCNQCDNKYWESSSSSCRDTPMNCTTARIHSKDRCMGCATKTSQPKAWITSGVCYKCDLNCASCDEDVCTQCKSGWFWDGSNCVDCTTGTLDSKTKCDQCSRKVWDNGECKACPNECESCSAANSCDMCITGKIWSGSSCTNCLIETEPECKSCGTMTWGNYFETTLSQCRKCSEGCVDCPSGNTCDVCSSSGYYRHEASPGNFQCKTCSGGMTLDTEEKCKVCNLQANTGRHWTGTECVSCAQNCLKCTAADNCEECLAGTYWDSGTTSCKTCIAKCSECADGTSCKTCNSNHYFEATGKTCTSCHASCTSCETAQGCTACGTGFFVKDKSCSACPSNCNKCSSSTVCTTCKSGRYWDAAKKSCENCMEGCAQCTSATTCSMCMNSRCWDETEKKCHSTNANCVTCKKDGSGSTISCLTCTATKFLEVCTGCDVANCMDCSSDKTKCDTCSAAFYKDNTGSNCLPCVASCKECTDDQSCSECMPSKFWDDTAKSCSSCPSNCAVCSASDSCDKCTYSNAFWDDTSKSCKNCMSKCLTCSDADSCSACQSGTFFDATAKSCTNCPASCATCTDADTCTQCYSTHFKAADGKCKACSDNFPQCSACSLDSQNTFKCTSCKADYVLKDDGTSCISCGISSCQNCLDKKPYCSDCKSPYLLTPDKFNCAESCVVCNGVGEDSDCAKELGNANSTNAVCHGLGSTKSCKMSHIKFQNGTVHVSRACVNETCSDKNQICKSADGDVKMTECSICCTGDRCNTALIKGKSNAPIIYVNTFYLIATVSLSQIFSKLNLIR